MGKRRKDPPRIGEYLPCDSDLLERAFSRQRELASSGVRKRLGEILLETGAVTQGDLVTAIHSQRLDRFRICPVFDGLREEELKEIALFVGEESVARGGEIIHQDEMGDCFYIVVDGQALVFWTGEAGEEIPLATLEPGEVFGEMGCFSDGRRSASVRAQTDMQILRISYSDLERTMSMAPRLARNFSDIVTRRLRRVNLLFQESVQEVRFARTLHEQLQNLIDMSEVLALRMDVESLIERVIHTASKVMNAERASLFLVDKESKELWSTVAQGEENREIRVPIGKGLAGWVAQHNQLVNVPDAYKDQRFNTEVDSRTGYRTKSILCGPVRNREEEIFGVLQILNKRKTTFNKEDEVLFWSLSQQIAVSLENFQVYERILSGHEKMAMLLDVALSVTRDLDPDTLLDKIMAKIGEILEKRNEEENVRRTLLRYMTEDIVDEVLSDQKKQVLGGVQIKATVLFSDLRGFTEMADTTSAEEVVKFLNEYFTRMAGLVLEERGIVDKYIGDELMAVFGIPRVQEDDALRAVRVALAIKKELARINQAREEQGLKSLGIGVGINTGEVIAGNIGSEKRMDFTVVGDSVNLASRLEQLTKSYGSMILISDFTYRELGEHFVTRSIDRVRIRGKKKPVQVIEVLGDSDYQPSEGEHYFDQGMEAYGKKDFVTACHFFEKGAETDPPCQVFLMRCRRFIEDPPKPDWDGVWMWEERRLVRPWE